MATRVFGSGGIEKEVRDDLDELLSLPQSDVDRITGWLAEARNPIPFTWSNIRQIVDGTNLEPRTVNRMLVLLRYLLTNWRIYGLTVEEIKVDVATLGYSKEQTDRLGNVLMRLQETKERVYRASLKNSFEIAALPTVDDINIVWDVRPVFEEFAYDAEPQENAYENLVTHTHVLLLEILASREDGKKESLTYQLSEDDFDRLFATFEKARRQLEVIKKRFLI